jgi:hypothetical protein
VVVRAFRFDVLPTASRVGMGQVAEKSRPAVHCRAIPAWSAGRSTLRSGCPSSCVVSSSQGVVSAVHSTTERGTHAIDVASPS